MDVAKPGDREAITILRRAAAETGRVSPAVAALLSRRALDLTPPGDRSRGLTPAETLRYLVYAGKAADGVRLMTAAAGDFADPAAEAEARLSLAHLSMQYGPADVVEQCRRALDLPDVPDRVRIHLLSFLSLGLDLFGDASAAEKTVQDAIEAAKASDDHENQVFTLIPQAAQALHAQVPRPVRCRAARGRPGRGRGDDRDDRRAPRGTNGPFEIRNLNLLTGGDRRRQRSPLVRCRAGRGPGTNVRRRGGRFPGRGSL
jgi:hypothetical protein